MWRCLPGWSGPCAVPCASHCAAPGQQMAGAYARPPDLLLWSCLVLPRLVLLLVPQPRVQHALAQPEEQRSLPQLGVRRALPQPLVQRALLLAVRPAAGKPLMAPGPGHAAASALQAALAADGAAGLQQMWARMG